MSPQVSYRVEKEVLLCFIIGERAEAATLDYWQQILDRCQQEGLKKLQITVALTGRFSPVVGVDQYQKIIDLLKTRDYKYSLIDLNQESAGGSQVGCHMAASQGVDIAYFEKENEALDWLISEASQYTHFELISA
ncbi:MAG: hypothetical protein Q9M92_05810 [Enterobacterales bacterium]|nr:hypothetical protein [Enterobacterales bacterium]